MGDVSWLVLPGLLRTGEALYKAAAVQRAGAEASESRGRLAGDRLEDCEPW